MDVDVCCGRAGRRGREQDLRATAAAAAVAATGPGRTVGARAAPAGGRRSLAGTDRKAMDWKTLAAAEAVAVAVALALAGAALK